MKSLGNASRLGRRVFVSLGIGIVLMLGVSQLRRLHAQAIEPTPAATPAAAAPAPGPAPTPSPTPRGPDPTGAVTGTA
ncbi:MAG TPA: hypothetical protein VL691_16910, partial [Vicinamibacteria bacterium]|nr:hypothetical protein [Vicinamibacteria bacterium]